MASKLDGKLEKQTSRMFHLKQGSKKLPRNRFTLASVVYDAAVHYTHNFQCSDCLRRVKLRERDGGESYSIYKSLIHLFSAKLL